MTRQSNKQHGKWWMMAMALSLMICHTSFAPLWAQPKREFRGAWIQCVNGQFQGMGTHQMQQDLTRQLDALQQMGANAVIFQVRPECDALYESELEPWSRFLTGRQGVAPQPRWDPLAWMVTECHRRGMELHAWINPYRAKTKGTTELSPLHVARRQPQSCFEYDGLLILNPGLPENRDYICQVVTDIVSRYDIDGLHIDDYFYPYPVAGLAIPDAQAYRQYSNGIADIGDWRRYNVSLFVQQLYHTVHALKPWVKVGISPFGIYRNKTSDPNGSDTHGLQNYDDLYAEVLLWVNNGWLDYCVPQVYWEIGHKAADYAALVPWWARHASNRPLYIGEDVERTVKAADPQRPDRHQQQAKHRLRQQQPAIQGTVLWPARSAVDNVGNYATVLQQSHWRTPALQPLMPFIDKHTPARVKGLKPIWTSDGYILCWTPPKGRTWKDTPTAYVVYRFDHGQPQDTNDPRHIVAITQQPFLRLPYDDGRQRYTYVVTALNRLQNESKPTRKNIKL